MQVKTGKHSAPDAEVALFACAVPMLLQDDDAMTLQGWLKAVQRVDDAELWRTTTEPGSTVARAMASMWLQPCLGLSVK